MAIFRKVMNLSTRSDFVGEEETEFEATIREACHSEHFRMFYPFVPRVHRIFNDPKDGLVIEMTHIQGMELYDFLMKYPEKEAMMNRKVEAIIHLLNGMPFYHGDIHHGNLMVDRKENVWLIDFGLSRIKGPGDRDADIDFWRERAQEMSKDLEINK